MSPDFEYLWRLRTEWRWSHTPLGLLYFCLPVGLAVLALWVGLVRQPVRHLLALQPAPIHTSIGWWLRASVAIVIGAATHVVWDGFTHGFAWSTQAFPALQTRLTIAGLSIPLFNVLQHLSTLLGGAMVLAWLFHGIRRGTPAALRERRRLGVFGAISVAMAAIAIWNASRLDPATNYWTLQIQVGRAAIGAMDGLGLGLLVLSVIHRMAARALPQA